MIKGYREEDSHVSFSGTQEQPTNVVVSRIELILNDEEAQALAEMCESELRSPDQQVKWLLRQEIMRRKQAKTSSVYFNVNKDFRSNIAVS